MPENTVLDPTSIPDPVPVVPIPVVPDPVVSVHDVQIDPEPIMSVDKPLESIAEEPKTEEPKTEEPNTGPLPFSFIETLENLTKRVAANTPLPRSPS
jgi:hypothetical protein